MSYIYEYYFLYVAQYVMICYFFRKAKFLIHKDFDITVVFGIKNLGFQFISDISFTLSWTL